MSTNRVFAIMPSWEDEREYENITLKQGGWNNITKFAQGELSLDEYIPLQLNLNLTDMSLWDLYRCPGTYGVFSQKAISVLRSCLIPNFSLLEVYVNDALFYVLRIERHLDCLDKDSSKLIYFESDLNDVMRIELYQFRKDKIPDPTFFVIPEIQTHLFASHSIRDIILANNLMGISTVDTESPPSWFNY